MKGQKRSEVKIAILIKMLMGHSGINACGDSLLELSLKQEKECLEN
jgi:hypothetical protein